MVRVTGVMVNTVGVEFFCYHRDRPGSETLREELLQEHWSYMDRYQAQMIARGPTLDGAGIWCSASARGRPPTLSCRRTGTS